MEDKFKRFLVFGYDSNCAAGGMEDCFGSFDTIEEAVDAINKDDQSIHDVFDRIEGVVVPNLMQLGYKGNYN